MNRNPLGEVLALDRNVAIMAGAGAGKTHNLVSMCLHLLAGARNGAVVAPAQLCLLTFTDKAAGELRERLRSRVEALAQDPAAAASETALQETLQRLGKPMPPQAFWRRVLDELGTAMVGTFHSLCIQILRQAPSGTGLDMGFELLDDEEAQTLVFEQAEEIVLEALEARNPYVEALCQYMGFTGGSAFSAGLVDALCHVYGKLREEGLSPEDIVISDEARARQLFESAVKELEQLVSENLANLKPKDVPQYGPVLATCARALSGMTVENFFETERYPTMAASVNFRGMSNKIGLKDVKFKILGNDKTSSLADVFGQIAVVPFEKTFVALLQQLRTQHAEALLRQGAIDFAELLIRTRNGLRDNLHFRRQIQSRIGALLVDEFQDTNRLQLELVTLLSEKRSEGPRRMNVPELPLEPGFLCAVGDRKQSIYEFRGADVSVFEVLAEKIEREDGLRAFLKNNWRSTPGLLTFFNGLFPRLMSATEQERDFQTRYVPEADDLLPVRTAPDAALSVERLVFQPEEKVKAEIARQVDAERVAERVRSLLDDGFTVHHRDGSERKGRGGDIALLFRRFTHLEVYRQALIRRGIPHRVVRGRGFYCAQEVLDVSSFLSLLADESDGIAFAAVLRSVWVGLSDDALTYLAQACDGRLSLRALKAKKSVWLKTVSAEDDERLQHFLKVFQRLSSQKDRLSLRELLRVGFEEFQFRVAWAATAFAEQALANLDKLLELAAQWDRRGPGQGAAFARRLRELSENEPTESLADVIDAADNRAVSLLTIHQSKGLEWPVVFLPDLSAGPRNETGKTVFDRRLGLALKPLLDVPLEVTPPRHDDIREELKLRMQAESLRLLYVAMTRAKDRLILSGAGAGTQSSWWKFIDEALKTDETLRSQVNDLPFQKVEPALRRAEEVRSGDGADRQRVDEAISRVRQPTLTPSRSVVLPVTHLQDLLRCPRRFHYLHHLGLSDVSTRSGFESEKSLEGDARTLGSIAHRMIELTDLSWPRQPGLRDKLKTRLLAEGLSPESRDGQELLQWVERFWMTPFAQRICRTEGSLFKRELPFMLTLSSPRGFSLHVRGQIDLLWLDEQGVARVVDYKFSRRPPTGLEPYRFQLACYALATRRLLGNDVKVEAGVSFLRDDAEPEFFQEDTLLSGQVEQGLLSAVGDLLEVKASGEWPGQPEERCRQMACGFVARCHARN